MSSKAIVFPIAHAEEIQRAMVKANETESIARSIYILQSISIYSLLQLSKSFCFFGSEKIRALVGAKARARILGVCQRALSAI